MISSEISADEIRRFGSECLGPEARAELTELVAKLSAISETSISEFRRYLATTRREIDFPWTQLSDRLSGRTVLVTGDTGCIGTALVGQLVRLGVERLIGVSLPAPGPPRPGVTPARMDIRDGAALTSLIERAAPDIVFHLAAQRDPGLAERALGETVTTNVLGTLNVIEACERAGVPQIVYASTGKALRPYTTHVYAESKRVSERIVADAAVRGSLHCSAARFTHVVDNAILLDRLRRWTREDGVIRLHSLDSVFYVQSAIESAQLLLVAALAPRDGVFRVHSICDLGWPVSLLDLALGVIAESGIVVPVQEVGHEPGYEREPYPGLFDPVHSGTVSPLFNAMEAPTVEPAASRDVDAARDQRTLTPQLREHLGWMARLAETGAAPRDLAIAFDDLATADLRQTVSETPLDVLSRIARTTAPYRATMTGEHRRIDDSLLRRLAQVGV